MKQSIVIAVIVLSLPAAILSAGNGQVDIRNSCGDTLWSNAKASLDIYVANDVVMCGMVIPIVLSSPDGVSWQWNSQPTGWGASRYVTHNPNARIEPPIVRFDMTGGLAINEQFLPDSIIIGGSTMEWGPPAGPLEHWLSIHLTPSAPVESQTGQFCLDLTQKVWNTTFSFTDCLVAGLDVTFLDENNDGVWCWPVVAYIPGDANGNRLLNTGDAIYIVNYIFRDGPALNPTEAADTNCDGKITVGDAVYIVNYIFREGPAPCGQ